MPDQDRRTEQADYELDRAPDDPEAAPPAGTPVWPWALFWLVVVAALVSFLLLLPR